MPSVPAAKSEPDTWPMPASLHHRLDRNGLLGISLVAVSLMAASGQSFADTQRNLTEPALESRAAAPAYENERGSRVFVPIPVANPTFGNGLQLGALYLHAPGDDAPQRPRAPASWRPTTAPAWSPSFTTRA
jgi:hypothetical protein